jgi:hypothetical protein
LNKLPDKIASVNIGGGVSHPPRSYAPEEKDNGQFKRRYCETSNIYNMKTSQ